MGLVDDIDPVFAHRRSEVGLVPEVPDIVHAVVAGGIDLQDIQHRAIINAPADFAFPAGVSVLGIPAVERLGKDLGTGGLAGATASGKQIGMGRIARCYFALQCVGDMLLPDHIRKGSGTVFPIQRNMQSSLPPSVQLASNPISKACALSHRQTGLLRHIFEPLNAARFPA